MKPEAFDEWTRVERANWKRGLLRERWRRRLLALVGVGLILFAAGFVLADLAPPAAPDGASDPAARPTDRTLWLTVPKMRRVEEVPVRTAAADDNAALDAGVIHVRGTGFPWESGANVYIAGHRLGYPNTGSFLVFYDLNRLREGDRVLLDDAEGRRYVYRVFEELTVEPDEVSVTEPLAGKSVVSLQACTLPDYSRRLIVRAELEKVLDPPNDPQPPPASA